MNLYISLSNPPSPYPSLSIKISVTQSTTEPKNNKEKRLNKPLGWSQAQEAHMAWPVKEQAINTSIYFTFAIDTVYFK